MSLLLRFIGLINAAVWFGAAVFFTVAAPVFFTDDTKNLLGEAKAGLTAMMLLERYFVLQYWCGGIAIVHQLAEWVYLGRPFHRLTVGVLLGIYVIALAGGLWLQPKLAHLHSVKYNYRQADGHYVRSDVSAQGQVEAKAAFSRWHGISMALNLAVMGGLVFCVWRVANPLDGPRFISANKFRS